MAKFVCLLVCLAVLVPAALSLKCYSCSSEKESGCLKSANPGPITCNPTVTNAFKNVCVYKHTVTKDKVAINASCGVTASDAKEEAASLMECKQIPGGPEIKECRVCGSDLCNSASAFSINYVTVLLTPILYFVTRLVAH